jgi:hypothetical protein
LDNPVDAGAVAQHRNADIVGMEFPVTARKG